MVNIEVFEEFSVWDSFWTSLDDAPLPGASRGASGDAFGHPGGSVGASEACSGMSWGSICGSDESLWATSKNPCRFVEGLRDALGSKVGAGSL